MQRDIDIFELIEDERERQELGIEQSPLKTL